MDVHAAAGALGRALAGEPDVRSAWLFGSAARGQARLDSDVDVGVWMDEGCSFERMADLSARLQRTTGLPVDLIVLNRATPLLVLDAVHGVGILTRDPSAELEWVLQAAREAEDWGAFVRSFLAERRRAEEAVGR